MAVVRYDVATPLNFVKRDGYNDTTRTLIGGFLTVAAIGSAAYNSVMAVNLAMREWEIAKKYWKLANNWLNYYKDYYAPVENQEAKEALALKDEKPEYMAARGRARAATWIQFKNMTRKALQCTARYCTGKRQDIVETLAHAQADALAMSDALGYRNERAYIEARSDERFKKQFATAKRGRDMVADAAGMASAAAGIYGQLYDQAWQGLKGAGTYLGYSMNRVDTGGIPDLRFTTTAAQAAEDVAAAVSATQPTQPEDPVG